jgi:Na+/H+ antiporter NhaD/arsenite permease-like protein
MAFLPLHLPEWWERNYGKVSFVLAAVTVGYYGFVLPVGARQMVARTAGDYAGFIVLIGALYVVCGGIHIGTKGEATPARNTAFLALGGLMSNVLGTTGASMLLIRPWLRMNEYRATSHHVVFFIFIVANVGGCLTPIGDPPLLVGYLRGVPFWWVAQHCWPMWLASMAFLLAVFFAIDRRNYARAPRSVRNALTETEHRWSFDGLWNIGFLAVIVGAVFISRPPFLREGIMLAAAAGSFFTTGRQIRRENRFTFGPMAEVAVLFFGIFATMMPALDLLHSDAHLLFGGSLSPPTVYWCSGLVSGFLDSAPAYLGFLSALQGMSPGGSLPALLKDAGAEVVALSVGTVVFGAITYLGNGPNLMVKSMADEQKIRSPAFLGYLFKWAVPIMLPLLIILWLVFIR